MVNSVLKFFLIFSISLLLISCNQIMDFEEEEPIQEQEPQESTIDEELAFETVYNYYLHLLNKRYAMALFLIDYSENPSDTVMDLEALDFFLESLSYSIDDFEVDRERTLIKDGGAVFNVQITISFLDHEEQKVIERVHVSESDELFKIVKIQSWDMFLPHRTYNYGIENPR